MIDALLVHLPTTQVLDLVPTAGDPPTWADELEAWSTLGGALVALAAAVATIWLLVHQIRETNRARADAKSERVEAAADRELARKDRELATAERREAVKAQARTVVIGQVLVSSDLIEGAVAVKRVQVPVSNFGPQPVFDLRVVLDCASGPIPRVPYVMDGTSALGPGRTFDIDFVLDLVVPWGATEDQAAENVVVWIAFTDAAGLQWTRRMTAQPEQVVDLPTAG